MYRSNDLPGATFNCGADLDMLTNDCTGMNVTDRINFTQHGANKKKAPDVSQLVTNSLHQQHIARITKYVVPTSHWRLAIALRKCTAQ